MKPRLLVGNHNYSSWSLRPWLCLKWAEIDFDEQFVDLDQDGYGAEGIAALKTLSPSGKVPVLTSAGEIIWDSLAIAEWAADVSGRLLPDESTRRALVRSAVAEMHSGFIALRRDLPMNIRRRCRASSLPDDAMRDLDRLDRLWVWGRTRFAHLGPFLFGERSLADAFFLPVATRLRTYDVKLVSDLARSYGAFLLEDSAFREWEARILAQPVSIFSRAPLDSTFPGSDVAGATP